MRRGFDIDPILMQLVIGPVAETTLSRMFALGLVDPDLVDQRLLRTSGILHSQIERAEKRWGGSLTFYPSSTFIPQVPG